MADKWIRPDLAHVSQRRALADPRADFDPVVYLVNITTRPAYTSATADRDPIFGNSICDKVSRIADWAEDHSPYLISQAVNETASRNDLATAKLCRALSAAAGSLRVRQGRAACRIG
jgi:hypothetical protein